MTFTSIRLFKICKTAVQWERPQTLNSEIWVAAFFLIMVFLPSVETRLKCLWGSAWFSIARQTTETCKKADSHKYADSFGLKKTNSTPASRGMEKKMHWKYISMGGVWMGWKERMFDFQTYASDNLLSSHIIVLKTEIKHECSEGCVWKWQKQCTKTQPTSSWTLKTFMAFSFSRPSP